MKLSKKYLLLFLIPLLSFSVHKYYLSLTQIEYVKDKQSVQIILRVFMDDIELAINKNYEIDAQLTTDKEVVDVDSYFKKYLQNNLHIKINQDQKNYTFIGKEYEGDVVYFYLEIENIPEISSLEITNSVLTDHFPDQQNLVKAKANGKYDSKLLDKENDKGLLKF